jgi:hypothetical protein
MKTTEAVKAIETLKKLAAKFTLVINFGNSEMRDSGEPVIRISIEELDIEVEEPILLALEKVNMEVEEYFQEC